MSHTLAAALAGALALAGCTYYDKDDFVVTPTEYASALSLSVSSGQDSLLADGADKLTLIAAIPDTAPPVNKKITFTTTLGTLVGGGKSGASIEVAADPFGIARVELTSPRTPGTAYVTATSSTIAGIADAVTIRIVPVRPDSALRITSRPSTAPANGDSLSRFDIAMPAGLPAEARRITVTVMGATLAPGSSTSQTIEADAFGRASFFVRSPIQPGAAEIVVAGNGATAETSIAFTRQPANHVRLDVGAFTIKAGPTGSLLLYVELKAATGRPSTGTVVSISAHRPDGTALPSADFAIRAVTASDTEGKATAVLCILDSNYRGPVLVRASAPGAPPSDPVSVLVTQ